MKIPQSVRTLYSERLPIYQLLERRIQELFTETKKKEWFYHARIKTEDAFLLKLETGRVDDPSSMEDFFACTLVVENRAMIESAIDLVKQFCSIEYMRPPNNAETHKRPESFSFDDLRLYVKLTPKDHLRPSALPIEECIFEIQIKTFLQHAWSIATHDLVYKGAKADWARARVAYQIKAMLEHAEISIEMANQIADSKVLGMTDKDTASLLEFLEWIGNTWEDDALPTDRIRLAQTLVDLARSLRLKLADLRDAIQLDTANGIGTKSMNLSPYGATILALFHHKTETICSYLNSTNKSKSPRLFLVPELELDQSFLMQAMPQKFVSIQNPSNT